MKKGISALIVIIVVAVGLALVVGHKKTTDTTTKSSTPAATTTPAASSSSNTVDIKGFAFSPKSITVKRGTTVTWTNKDSAAHTVTFDDASMSSASSGTMAQGDTFSHKFDATGTFAYHCAIHTSMTATVVVTD